MASQAATPRGVPVARIDTNGDGFISREEHEAFRQRTQEHRDGGKNQGGARR
jgi:hypothetical protein